MCMHLTCDMQSGIISASKRHFGMTTAACTVTNAYIQQCLLSEHKHSKQNDDIYMYTAFGPKRTVYCIYMYMFAMFML